MSALNIYQRINAVMRDVSGVEKESLNKHSNYRYAGHQAVNDAIRHAFVKHGIVQLVSVTSTEVLELGTVKLTVLISWVSTDDPTSRVEMGSSAIQPTQTTKGTLTAQQVGQCISYAVKCAQFKGLMLRGDNEPDSDESDTNGPSYEEQASVGSLEQVEAAELLSRYGQCPDIEAVKALTALLRSKWPQLRVVPNLADQIQKASAKATARLKGAAAL